MDSAPRWLGVKYPDSHFISSNGAISSQPLSLAHFFAELIGPTASLLQIMQNLINQQITATPRFILEHMPKAYAIWTWNDYDKNG